MKIISIVGARPQFIKASVVSRAIEKHNSTSKSSRAEINETIVHTGQHYDENMSDVFFKELEIQEPSYNLGIGSGSHGEQTGKMLIEMEKVLLKESPHMVILYGDTNSTLAGALTSSKLHIPIAHVEAGLRSFNRRMPEETNRIITDRISNILFCPTETAVNNLNDEGILDGVYYTGDVMYDSVLHYLKVAEKKPKIIKILDLENRNYYLATIHRPENTDDPDRLMNILDALNELDQPVILPLHPRTKHVILNSNRGIRLKNIRIIEPVTYLDMLLLEKNSLVILTDSGGIQKEAYFIKVPCITLRTETEWIETIECGWNTIVGSDKDKILAAIDDLKASKTRSKADVYGDGHAGEKIVECIVNFINQDLC